MAQSNGIKATAKSLGAGPKDTALNPLPTAITEVFRSLVDSVLTLSADSAIGTILDRMDKIPIVEEEVKSIKEQEKLHLMIRQQLLRDYNDDRDGWMIERQGLQNQHHDLQEELARKTQLIEAQETAEKLRAEQIRSLQASTTAQNQDAEKSGKQIQGLIKAIETEKLKSRTAEASMETQKTQLSRAVANLEQLQKAYVLLQKRAEEDAQKLQAAATLTVPLKDDPQVFQSLNPLWLRASSTIFSVFPRDVNLGVFKVETFRTQMERLGLQSERLPLLPSNTRAAKHMRCVAILASVARVFANHLFQPTYLLPANSGMRDLLARQAKDHSAKESNLRASLQLLLPEEQESASSQAIEATCDVIITLVSGFLSPAEETGFCTQLRDIAEEACDAWRVICCSTDAVRTSFGITHYNNWNWDQLTIQSDQPVTSDLGQLSVVDQDAAIFAIFPRLYASFEGDEDPETHGVLFMKSQTNLAREEGKLASNPRLARNDSTRNELPKRRRPSNAANSTQGIHDKQLFLRPQS